MKAITSKAFTLRQLLRPSASIQQQPLRLFGVNINNNNYNSTGFDPTQTKSESSGKEQGGQLLNAKNQVKKEYKPHPKINLIIKSNAGDVANVNEKERFNKLIRESALGLYKNYKHDNSKLKATEEFMKDISKNFDGKTFTLFIKYLNELKADVLENKNHKLTPDSFLIFLDKVKNLTHSQQLNDIILRKMQQINIALVSSKKMLNEYQKNSIDFKFEENLRIDEIKQFASVVIPKPRFIFDNYKTTLNNSPAPIEETSEDQVKKQQNENEDYFSFFSSHEKVILKPESNFKNLRQFMEFLPIDYYILLQEDYETQSDFKKTNHVFYMNLPLIQKRRTQSKTTIVKNITYDDIMKSANKQEANFMINDEFASEQLIEHLEKRYGKVIDMFHINYNANTILDKLLKSKGHVKSNDLEEFEQALNGNIKDEGKVNSKETLALIDAENPVFEDLLALSKNELKEDLNLETTKKKGGKKKDSDKELFDPSYQSGIVESIKEKEKKMLGLENQIFRSGFIEFNSYLDKLKMMDTPLFLFGMKLHDQMEHIRFFDADFCNTITVESHDFDDKTLGDCCEMINEFLWKSGYEGQTLTIGKLKGIGDFDLSKIFVREGFKISLRFNNFENALKAFKYLTNTQEIKFKCLFQNPSPNYYDGKFATNFESCIKDKFEGLTQICEVPADYVKKQIVELSKTESQEKRNGKDHHLLTNQKTLDNYRPLSEGSLPLKREERELYEQAIHREGKVWKKSGSILVGFQKRYFKVIAKGSYLAYYTQKPTSKQTDLKPNGVFDISKLSNVRITQPKHFTFEFHERVFEMYTKTKEEAESWVVCLKFLAEQKSKEQETATSTRSASYFYTLANTLANQQETTNRDSGSNDTGSLEKRNKSKSQTRTKTHKFTNIDAKAFGSVIQQNPQLILDKDKASLSEKALITKGFWNYLKSVKEKTLKSRIMYGFLKKRSKGKIKYFSSRWFFLISSRPLNQEDFLNDLEVMSDSVLPPLLEFDVIYYYRMDTPDDASGPAGEIKTLNILKIEIKNMAKSKTEDGHAFIIDTGKKLFHLNTEHRFDLERWVEAIEISMQTSKERQLSITGACKNISPIVTLFDTNEDILRQQIEDLYDKKIPKSKEDWEDVESILQVCTELRDDMITTFDACLALKPQRKDIIELYMKVAHAHMSEVLSKFWEDTAVEMNPYETLSLVDWTYRYFKDLKRFGINDDSIENGYFQLCTTYAKKTHSQIMPLIINILKTVRFEQFIVAQEKELTQIEEDRSGFLYTNAPYDIVKMFSESFQVVVAKGIKELILKTLKMFQIVTQQYQKALSRILEVIICRFNIKQTDTKLTHDFLIAQCNNCFIYFELMEDLLQQVSDICTDDEIDAHFSQRLIQQFFLKMQQILLNQMTNAIFKLRLDALFNRNFLDLDMEGNLNDSFKLFQAYASKMSKSTSRQAWTCFLERTVLCYIQCMLNSSKKIRQKSSEEAIAKIKEDYQKISLRFGKFMTTRSMKSGIEVLDDLVSFFESSPAFISVACEKLRKTHGPTFKLGTVKAILNLRTDLTKDERTLALKICDEILQSFKNSEYDNPSKKGIFSNLDTTQAEQIIDKDSYLESLDTHNNQVDTHDDAPDIDLEDFLKQGGIDLEQIDDDELSKEKQFPEAEERKNSLTETYNIDPDDKMSGWLIKSSIRMEKDGGEDILGFMINGIGNGLKMGLKIFTETMQIKQKKQYFAIKNGTLYWYSHERAREAENQIEVKTAKAVEINKNNPKEFYILCKKKCYRLQCDQELEAQKWVNSLKAVREMDSDYLDINRYEKLKIYSKITGRSMYRDYDHLLEEYENDMHDVIEHKLQEYLQKRNKWKSVESNINQQAKNGLKKQQSKKEAQIEQSQQQIFKQDEENFVRNLEETSELMNKMNPTQIDLYQAAFGSEDVLYAQQVCKKIQQRAVKKVMTKSFVKNTKNDELEFQKNTSQERFKTEVTTQQQQQQEFFEQRTMSTHGRNTQVFDRQISEQDQQQEEESDDSDWGLEENDDTPYASQKKRGIMKNDGMQGLSLRRLEIDPDELIKQQPIQSPLASQQSASCFACFSLRNLRSKK